jgi:subtilisin family serine protease
MKRLVPLALLLAAWVFVPQALAAERVLVFPQDLSATARTATPSGLQTLRSKASGNGTIKVIVGLRVPFAAEGALLSQQAREQRTEIAAAASTLRSRFGGAVSRNPEAFRSFGSIPFIAMEVTPAELDRLAADPLVISIAENALAAPGLRNSMELIGGTAARQSGFTGLGQTIAIIDTGVDKTHPFLGNRVVSEACYSAGGWCPGGRTSSTAPGSGMPCPGANCEHGTHVAGIAAGMNSSMAGVASQASLIAIQVFSNTPLGTRAYHSDVIAGLERVYALRNQLDIAAVNLSLGGGQFFSACDAANAAYATAINNLRSVGIATVAASGNEGYTSALASPACVSSAISVGAVSATAWGNCRDGQPTARDKVACFSNSASYLSLLAPGTPISSSIPGNRYAAYGGTSMAAPHVAGAVAVLKQKSPDAGVNDILAVLQGTGAAIQDYRNGITKPRINVFAALNAIEGPDFEISYTRAGSGGGTVTFSPAGSVASCEQSCSSSFDAATVVVMTAAPAAGSRFIGWGGACAGTRSCRVRVESVRALTATFDLIPTPPLAYVRSGSGSGTVSFSPAGSASSCTASCTRNFTEGTRVTLTAVADVGSRFTGWSGACRGTRSCRISMREARSVTATFTSVPVRVLTYTQISPGSGSVSLSPAGSAASCAANCAVNFSEGTRVMMTATAAAGSRFTGWSGACRGTRSCRLTMSEARSVTATFTATQSASTAGLRH